MTRGSLFRYNILTPPYKILTPLIFFLSTSLNSIEILMHAFKTKQNTIFAKVRQRINFMGRGVKILYHNILTPPPNPPSSSVFLNDNNLPLSIVITNEIIQMQKHYIIRVTTGRGGGGGSIYYGIIF